MNCANCGDPINRQLTTTCPSCSLQRATERARIGGKARTAVALAIKRGVLPPAKTQVCTDCGKPAFCYDHRDYAQPLAVDPVCKRCDCLRGPGAPYDGFDARWAKRQRVHKIVGKRTPVA